MTDHSVIRFPSVGRRARGAPASSDERLAAEIRKAWRKLARAIGAARAGGLHVETHFRPDDHPTIERRL